MRFSRPRQQLYLNSPIPKKGRKTRPLLVYPVSIPKLPPVPMLSSLDRSLTLDKTLYQHQMEDLMQQLRQLQHQCWRAQLPCVVVLEGWAASGKGALVKKVVQ